MKIKKRTRIVPLITLFSLMVSVSAGIMVNDSAKAQSKNETTSSVKTRSSLRRYTRDLTSLAVQGRLELAAITGLLIRPRCKFSLATSRTTCANRRRRPQVVGNC
jgi:hypothetical protein